MTEHTPGPWHVDPDGNATYGWRILAVREPGIPVSPATAHSLPDAHLIAAAPELLAALEGLLCPILDWDAVRRARAAIAAARGDTR